MERKKREREAQIIRGDEETRGSRRMLNVIDHTNTVYPKGTSHLCLRILEQIATFKPIHKAFQSMMAFSIALTTVLHFAGHWS